MTTPVPTRPFTGEEFLDSLRGGREIWIYGERVPDVTTHPAFRNPARMLARLYDALHAPATHTLLTCGTDTGSGSYTHRYFRAPMSAADLVAARDAIAAWARLTYGWMGRSPDYKASFLATLGANAEYYAPYQENARRWYRAAQERVLYLNHALVQPPVDRHRPPDEVADVYVHVEKETDAGLVVSGAKVVATGSALTHANFIAHPTTVPIKTKEFAVVFIAALLLKAVDAVGSRESKNVQASVGETIAWRNLFWGLSDAMARAPVPWAGGSLLPNPEYAQAYRVFSTVAYPRVKELTESILGSALIYLNSHAADFRTPALRPYLDKYLRGSDGTDAVERVKLMKLLWDAMGTEFGGRHELYERNYAGAAEAIRVITLDMAQASGQAQAFRGFAEQCMAEYDLDGWTVPDLITPEDVNLFLKKRR